MDLSRLQPYFLLTLIIAAALLVFFIFKPFLIPLAMAAICAVILKPAYQYFLRRMPRRPSVAALVTIVLAVICIIVPLSLLGSQVTSEAQQLLVSVSDGSGGAYVHDVVAYGRQWIERYMPDGGQISTTLSASVDGYLKTALLWSVTHLGALFSSATQLLFSFFIFLFALYYLLRDGERLREVLVHLSPLADMDDKAVFDRLELAVNSVVKGNLTLALLQGVLSGIGLAIFGVPNPVLWGAMAGLSALIPGVGTSIVLLPAALFLLLTGSVWAAAGLLIWAILAVGLIDNLLGPKLVGRGARLHPLIVLLSVLGGVALFGPAGLFLGPLCSSLLFALLAIHSASAA